MSENLQTNYLIERHGTFGYHSRRERFRPVKTDGRHPRLHGSGSSLFLSYKQRDAHSDLATSMQPPQLSGTCGFMEARPEPNSDDIPHN
jgi:hypothetical protein